MTPNGTSAADRSPPLAASARSAPVRIDWVDYAKGICIVMVVMMHSVLGVELAAGQTGFMHGLVAFAKPFRMPHFFLSPGLFLSVVIDRDWRTYLDRKVVHFAYFYVLWVTIQFGFKAPSFAAETGWAHAGLMYLESFIEPFGTLWFIYLLPVFFVVAKATRRMPPLAIWAVAALLEMAHIATGWTVIDEFGARFVYFYSGYLFAHHVFSLSDRARARGRAAHLHQGHAAGAGALAQFPALWRQAFDRHLSCVLPADGGDADAAAARRPDPRHRDHLACRHHRRRRRGVGAVAHGASGRRRFPVRAPGRILDRTEKAARDAASGGVGLTATSQAVIARRVAPTRFRG